MENKNIIIAVILSMAFMFLWSTKIMPRFTPHPPIETVQPGGVKSSKEATLPAEQSMQPAHADALNPKVMAETILRDAQNEIAFTSVGGAVSHWRLNLKGHEVDLVATPENDVLPLATFPESSFKTQLQGTKTAISRAVLENGLRFSKTLTLADTGYLHNVTYRFDNPTSRPIELKDFVWGWGPGLGTADSEKKENSGLIRALSKGKLKAHVMKPGDYSDFGEWVAIDNRYFLVAFLPVESATPVLKVIGAKDKTQVMVQQPVSVPAQGSLTLKYQIYAGPKGYTQLGHYKKGLEEAVDFGFFSPVGKLVLRSVYWLQGKTGNYGVAIIILTIGLQLLMFPLTIKSFKATMAMKKLQPQIAALQKDYKSDPKRLNVEMMNLYKKSGTNPFGGCLPMLLQLPIFWALFTTLRNAYELRGAPFFGWIHDLSAADPFHILPIVMGIAMFFQQRMSGATSDPTQRQMMMIMPVMFTFMFFNFPAGLVLYWLTNNLITMSIQWGLMQYGRQEPAQLEIIK